MRSLTAQDVMNPEVLTVNEEMSVRELAEFLLENEISGAPVENRSGHLVGVVSTTDIAAASGEESEIEGVEVDSDYFLRGWEETANPEELERLHVEDEGLLVRDIMTPAVYSIESDTPVSKIAQTMVDAHIHRLLVTRNDEFVGIVSSSDLLGLLVDTN